jgi:two-component system, OmpR family, sensor histidine kinase ArlS
MKLRVKVMNMNMLIIIIILLIAGFIVIRTVDNFNLYTRYQYLLSQSDFTDQYLSEYFKIKDVPEKTLVTDREELENMLEKHVGCDVEIIEAGANSVTELQRQALSGNRAYFIGKEGKVRQFYMSSPVYAKGTVIGCVNFTYSLYQADMMKRSLLFTLSILLLAALLLSLVLSYLFSRRLLNPLEKLTHATKEYSKFNFIGIDNINTGDEIEGLANSFNTMGNEIKMMINKIKDEQDKQKKFVDNVTHEIRTPLTNIMGYADLLNRGRDETQKTKYLSNITSESNRLLNMVNNLLELSRLNRYEFAIQKTKTNLKETIEQAAGLMSDRIKKFGFEIEYNLESVTAMVDGEKIKQVIINLIDNAIKYSEGDYLDVKLWKSDMVYISVCDNGKGIPLADIENISEPFYRSDKSRSRKLGGSGLGLSICKEIANAHGGTMNIDSNKGHGTTVTISLQG